MTRMFPVAPVLPLAVRRDPFGQTIPLFRLTALPELSTKNWKRISDETSGMVSQIATLPVMPAPSGSRTRSVRQKSTVKLAHLWTPPGVTRPFRCINWLQLGIFIFLSSLAARNLSCLAGANSTGDAKLGSHEQTEENRWFERETQSLSRIPARRGRSFWIASLSV